MRDYYGIYHGKIGWAGRSATYPDDQTALASMRTLALKKMITNEDGEKKEKMFFLDLDYLLCGKRVVFNG